MDVLTDQTYLLGLSNGENEQNTDGMAWRAKKFRTITLVRGQFFLMTYV